MKLPFTRFRCPRCRLEQSFSLVFFRSWKTEYWCPGCDSLFLMEHEWVALNALFLSVFGIAGGLLLGPLNELLDAELQVAPRHALSGKTAATGTAGGKLSGEEW